jgi:Arc/MetJ-type ribon-helix-helix transcriptional regulator
MADTFVVIPEDLKTELEAVSKREHRSEADVIRDALREYAAQHPEPRRPRSYDMAPNHLLDSAEDEESRAGEKSVDPRWPRSIGIGNSGRIQSDEVDAWLEKTWDRDW